MSEKLLGGSMETIFLVTTADEGKRLDKFVADSSDEVSRSRVKKDIEKGFIKVNGQLSKPRYCIKTGDEILYEKIPPKEVNIKPVDIKLNIVFEDEDLVIINKPRGMVVHPAPGHFDDTLVNAIMHHCGDSLSGINGELRPGIVHRIDKDTSGLLVICKNDFTHRNLAKQFKVHSIKRTYTAICYNHFNEEAGSIDAPIGRNTVNRLKNAINYNSGKNAVTHYMLIKNLKENFAYIKLRLETGRTHQIRVHMNSISHPILGDPLYGPKNKKYNTKGQLLHAKSLGFIHPRTEKLVEFHCEEPEDFKKILLKLSQ